MSGSKDWAQISAPKASRNRKLFRSIFDRKDKDPNGHKSDGNKSDTNTDDEREGEGWLKLRRGRSSRASSRVTSRAGSAVPTSRATSSVRTNTDTPHDIAGKLRDSLSLSATPTASRPSSMLIAPEEVVRTTLMEDYHIPAETIDLENIRFVLGSKFTQGDPAKAVTLIVAFRKAAAGLMHPYVSRQGEYTRLVGADNWNGVSCYFDSLMVAMFARMDNFEPMLYKNFEFDERRESLATLLRFYVTLLRQGCYITTDMTHKLMESLMEAEWCDGQSLHRQQDVSELFQFICDKMDMPLLTLKVDIAHGGKEVREDDHKLVNERMLHIPVPGDDSDPPILLEQCLEQYFSNSVNVRRQIERRKTLDQLDAVAYKRQRSYSTKSKKYHVHVETVEMLDGEGGSPSTLASRRTSVSSVAEDRDKKDPNTLRELQFVDQNRWYRYDEDREVDGSREGDAEVEEGEENTEIISEATADSATDYGESGESSAINSPLLPDTASVSTMVKNPRVTELMRKGSTGGQSTRSSLWNENSEITLPAWMFLQLLPFYSNTKGDTNSPAAVYFAKSKPVLVICLKRFCWTEAGVAKKNNRTVVIPDTIHFPSFVADQNLDLDYEDSEEAISDEDYETPKHPGAFKLVLESAVCHRGTSVHSGHYITLVSEQASRETVGGDYSTAERATKSTAEDEFDIAGARHQFRTRSGTVSSKISTSNEAARRRWLRFDDFQPSDKKFQEIDFEDAFTQESPYLLFYRMVADDEEDDPKSEYVQPIPDSHESREFDTDPMNAHMPPVTHAHKPSIGNIDMDNGRGLGRLRANFGIGGNTGNTSVGVTEVSCDSDDSYDEEYETVRVNHVTEGVGGTTINGLDTESIMEPDTDDGSAVVTTVVDDDSIDPHDSTLGAAPSYESLPSCDVSPTNTRAPPLPTVYPAHDSSDNVSTRSNLVQVPPPPITVDSPESRFGSESTASSMSIQPLDSESDAETHLNKSKSYSSIMSFLRRESYVAPVPEHAELPRSGAATGTVTPTEGTLTPGPAGAATSKKRFFLKKLASHSSEDDAEHKKEDRKEEHRRDKEEHRRDKEEHRREKEEKREQEKAEKREKKERKRQQKELQKEMRDKGKGKASDTARSSLDDEDREFRQYRDEKCIVS
ncbi:hypothetical protein CJU90_4319 [Yarrowia sp. C11]|nr:hypothetical protein CKK34_6602 [Yarrowia sp. E02]KAG5365254.1 hypothetical protein CJU90_4319 [Yarrowia sp. C11]